MASERDEIFQSKLVTLVGELTKGESTDKELRKILGAVALRLVTEGRAHTWTDLKERIDAATYDSLLRLFQSQSDAAAKSGDRELVRAIEILSVSLIARTRNRRDLVPGIQYIDTFIEQCADYARRAGLIAVPSTAKA